MDGEWVGRYLMRSLCHPVGGNHRGSELGAGRYGELFVKRCAATADETKRHSRTAWVILGSTVKEDAVNRGHRRVPRHSEAGYVCPKQVSREHASARKPDAAATRQSCQELR